MVCQRCVKAVKAEIELLGLNPLQVTLGEVVLKEEQLPENTLNELDNRLIALGFERVDDRKTRLITQIKTFVIQQVHHANNSLKINWSDALKAHLNYDYNYLSALFSVIEGITIEQYIIRQKVERVKELLVYDELNLSEISDKLDYSSVSHLSNQFKKVTGLTPSVFKKNHAGLRKPLDKI
jgi:YesN/AraC family two-component response regulator